MIGVTAFFCLLSLLDIGLAFDHHACPLDVCGILLSSNDRAGCEACTLDLGLPFGGHFQPMRLQWSHGNSRQGFWEPGVQKHEGLVKFTAVEPGVVLVCSMEDPRGMPTMVNLVSPIMVCQM